MSSRRHDQRPLSPSTVRLLHRLAGGLGAAAGVLFVLAFLLGVAREDMARWWLLGLGLLFLASPALLRMLMPPG